MKFFPKTLSGLMAATACFLTMSVSAFSATDKPVVVSAHDFIGGFSASRKTEIVAANKQRSFVVSAGKASAVLDKATSVVLTDFPVSPNSDAVVELERSRSIIDGETVFRKNGRPVDGSFIPPVVQTFRGKIRGEEHSKVVLTMIDGNMTGIVEHNDGERYVFSPMSDGKKDAREHMLFAESGVDISPEDLGFTCHTPDDVDGHAHSTSKAVTERTLSTDLLEFQLALETDYKMFQKFGGDDAKMRAYVFSLIAMVSSIYEDEINVTFIISDFNFWAEEDPYQAGGDISVMLEKFSAYWRSNNGGIKRSIAHLITGPGSTQVGGIAYRDQLCDKSLGYSVSGIHAGYIYPTTTYSWDVNVIAHEIGHNFRSHHTHACAVWGTSPLDTCVSNNPKYSAYAEDACFNIAPRSAPGSIMSYCHLLSGKVELTFTPPVIQVIRAGAEDAKCLTAPATAKIFIQNPLGNETFSAGAKVDIRWTSARVNMVGIEYSADGGQSWTNIVESVAATDRKYNWTVPAIASTQMLVRVYDVSNAGVNDQSTVVFKVSTPTLSLAYPVGGERIAQKSSMIVKWNKELVTSVAVDFSSDNGANWATQATGITAKEYTWTVPTVSTAQALIRVRDESNNAIVSQSQAFSIGAPIVQVSWPAANVQWTVGTTQQIRWSADFIDKVRIEYKTESKGWTRIGPFLVTASDGVYEWTVPNELSTQVLVRVRSTVDEAVSDTVGPITITNAVSVQEPVIVESSFSVVPQPANDYATIRFSLSAPVQSVRVAVQDVTGRTVAETFPELQTSGVYSIPLSTAPLAQGVYFIMIEAGGTTMSRTLTVLH